MNATSPHSPHARWGITLFAIYTLFYVAYVFVMAFIPEQSQREWIGGVNLAVWWGFALIAVAFVLAVVYGWTCRAELETSAYEAGQTPGEQESQP
ncbi:MAG: hypothetical protein KatS3mg111_2939 [Pirellulaceae bacterium]|nr:MAG: hypothetical protein KatS3mg111_2939 [Pirellulaceae bacterium]